MLADDQQTLSDVLKTILSQPYAAIAYHAHHTICEITQKAILQTEDQLFDILRFAQAGKCTLQPRASAHCQSRFTWKPKSSGSKSDFKRFEDLFQLGASSLDVGSGNVAGSLSEQILAGWYIIDWDGTKLETVMLEVSREGVPCPRSLYFVVAEAEETASRFIIAVQKFCAEMKDVVWVFERGAWQPNVDLLDDIKVYTFDNLVLSADKVDNTKHDMELFFKSEHFYQEYNMAWKRGFLFSGPPGNGKTHLIKALINHFLSTHPAISILHVKSFRTAHGSPDEYSISAVFRRARDRPSILIFEDLDTLITPQNRSFFLNEMDGFGSNSGVVVLAITNHPEKLDESIRDRPSRFDKRVEFGLPGVDERVEFVRRWNARAGKREMMIREEVLRKVCGDITEGFSFAYLKELLVCSAVRVLDAVRRGETQCNGYETLLDAVVMEQAGNLQRQLNRTIEHHGKFGIGTGVEDDFQPHMKAKFKAMSMQ
ncbi:hypothetical protein HK097_005201 [Rhizophlyctis rosea]|uniref:AAA+ ATPase domain-containing protein n=1 Tax=Rhizophlyctis rosea TaxID=64517 RepID=A0AAD5SGW1_9FUNG|nr:hypothetical protein HK097_005201 [Rhizophlyctis rosea]